MAQGVEVVKEKMAWGQGKYAMDKSTRKGQGEDIEGRVGTGTAEKGPGETYLITG